jgi:hypothetical protein
MLLIIKIIVSVSMYLRSSRKKLLNVPFWQYKGGGVLVKKTGGVLVKKVGAFYFW